MDLKKHGRHKEAIGDISPIARKVIFWSFVSLLFIYGDIYVGTAETTEITNNTVTLFGIQFFGITKEKFWYFLITLNLYHAVKFSFSVLKIIIIADSWAALKDTLSVKESDRHDSEDEIESIDKKLQSDEMSGKTNLEGGRMEFTDPKREAENQRELLLMMKRYNIMGFLEYFFSPIIFPASLSLWALIMLVIQVFC